MPDIFTKEKRSEVMSLIRSKNTQPEIALRKLISSALYPFGYRYRLHYKKLPGTPDLAFVSCRVAVFVDGGFWHGYRYEDGKEKLPSEYWRSKIKRNMARDRQVNAALRRLGWKVVRIWDHDLRKKPERVLKRIVSALDKQ